jgi:hypothetical protein
MSPPLPVRAFNQSLAQPVLVEYSNAQSESARVAPPPNAAAIQVVVEHCPGQFAAPRSS